MDAKGSTIPIEMQRRSERSFGGSFSSLSISSILGFDDELDQDPTLSDFQQQSLSVFESEHMWAHFKAHLADKHIHTTAGVKAMLPEFVNDRVLDGSVDTEGQNSSSTKSMGSYGPSVRMDRQDSHSTRNKRSVYPAAMRREESFGRNTAIYGRPQPGRSGSNQSIITEPDITSYHEAIRGDTDHVVSLYNCDSDADVNLLTSVSRRLSKMTSVSHRSRSNSVFSVMNESKDLRSSNDSEMSSLEARISLMTDGSGSGRSSGTPRPKFRRPSISADVDVQAYEHQLFAEDANTNPRTRRSSEISMESEYSKEIAALAEEVFLQVADQIEGLDEKTSAQYASHNADKLCPKQFSYQPQRHKVDRKNNLQGDPVYDGENSNETNEYAAHKNEVLCKVDQQEQEVFSFTSLHTLLEPQRHKLDHKDNLQILDGPVIDREKNSETNDSNAHKNEVYCADDQQEPLASSHTLLVEWGEDYSTSDEEDCYNDGSVSVDSEQAVIDRENLLRSSREEERNSTSAAETKTPKSRRSGLMAVFSSLALEKSNSPHR